MGTSSCMGCDCSHCNTYSMQIAIVDPTKINFTDLTGRERVGVINRNTGEMV